MLMPKTPMNKNRLLLRAPHDVWLTREFTGVQSKTITQTMNDRSHDPFRLHIE